MQYQFVREVSDRWLAFLSACGALLLCLAPFFLFGSHPLGYDTGWYRRYLLQPFVSFPNTPVPGLDHTVYGPRIFLDFVRTFGLPIDVTLYGSYFLLTVLTLLGAFLFLRAVLPRSVARFALILWLVSPVRYLGYHEMLFKHAFSFVFLLGTLLALTRGRYILALTLASVVVWSHQTATIILVAILGVATGVTFLRREVARAMPYSIVTTATVLQYLLLHPHVAQKIAAPPVALFLSREHLLLWMLPVVLMAILGARRAMLLAKTSSVLSAFLLVTLLWPLMHLPYSERLLVYTDLSLVVLAAIGGEWVVVRYGVYRARWVRLGIVGIMSILLVCMILTHPAVLPRGLLAELSALSEISPGKSVVTSPRLAPWVEGWSLGRVYAPGMLKDQIGRDAWQMYFANPQYVFLQQFPYPITIVVEESESRTYLPQESGCLVRASPLRYDDQCPPPIPAPPTIPMRVIRVVSPMELGSIPLYHGTGTPDRGNWGGPLSGPGTTTPSP